jgi:hypothetical protein
MPTAISPSPKTPENQQIRPKPASRQQSDDFRECMMSALNDDTDFPDDWPQVVIKLIKDFRESIRVGIPMPLLIYQTNLLLVSASFGSEKSEKSS